MERKSLLDNLPNELLFIIISYLDNTGDIKRLTASSDYLLALFHQSDTWKNLFYQNSRKDWKELYLSEVTSKHKLQTLNLLNADYFIISTGYTTDLTDNQIKRLENELKNHEPAELAFITRGDPDELIYENSDYTNILEKLLKLKLPGINLDGCIVISSDNLAVDQIIQFLKELDYCTIYGVERISSFVLDSLKFIYVYLETELYYDRNEL